MSLFCRILFLSVLLFFAGSKVCLAIDSSDGDDDFVSTVWQELNVEFPAPPNQAKLLPFFVSAASDNKFFIDDASLSVGDDGVVRYTLLVLAPEGGRNVSFEGMRCETKEKRIYANGRADGSWSKSRNARWARIQDVAANRQHATLYLDYFCPLGAIVRNVDEIREAFRRGGQGGWMRW